MAKKYARGKRAWGYDERTGERVYLSQLRSDGQYPGLQVTDQNWDPQHPQEIPPDMQDPVALRRPSPDRDKPGLTIELPTAELWESPQSLVVEVALGEIEVS